MCKGGSGEGTTEQEPEKRNIPNCLNNFQFLIPLLCHLPVRVAESVVESLYLEFQERAQKKLRERLSAGIEIFFNFEDHQKRCAMHSTRDVKGKERRKK